MKPPNRTKGSNWISFRPQDFPTMPRLVRVELKGGSGYADLTFYDTDAAFLHQLSAHLLEEGMSIHQTGASAAVRLAAPKLVTHEPLSDALPKLREAFTAVDRLICFYRNHRAELHEAAGPPR